MIRSVNGKLRVKSTTLFYTAYIILFILLSLHNISMPWQWNHIGYVGAEKSEFAYNYLKLGYIDTKFAQTYSTGILGTGMERYEPYLHHPPLMALYMSIFFFVFGLSESVARMSAVLLCIGMLILIFMMLRRFFDRNVAIPLGFIITISPMMYFLRHFAGMELLALFMLVATSYAYILWMDTKEDRWLYAMFACFAVGTLTDWQFYFIGPALFLHYLIFLMKKGHSKKFFFIIAVALLCFAGYLGFMSLSGGDYQGGKQWGGNMIDTLKFRLNANDASQKYGISYGVLAGRVPQHMIKYFTLPLLVLLGLWAANYAYKIFNRADIRYESLFILVIVFQMSFLFIFANLYWFHDFLIMMTFPMAYMLVGFLVKDIRTYAKKSKQDRRWLTLAKSSVNALLIFSIVLIVASSFQGIAKIEGETDKASDIIDFLAKHKGEDIMVSFDENLQNHQFKFYMNFIDVRKIGNIQDFENIMGESNKKQFYSYAITKKDHEEMNSYFMANYEYIVRNDYMIFKISEKPGETADGEN